MQFIYSGKNITNDVKIMQADIRDTAGGEADSIEICLSDAENLWREWSPSKGDVMELKQAGFSSGVMYVDYLQDIPGKFILKGRSTPPGAKIERMKTWENVRFMQPVNDIAQTYGFSVSTHSITDWLYDRLDQMDTTDFQFLASRCMLEGYCLKITNKKLTIYDEKILEKAASILTLYEQDLIGEYNLQSCSEGLFSWCLIRYVDTSNALITYQFNPAGAPKGPGLKPEIRAASLAEAQRYAAGLLRYKNKWETYGDITIYLNMDLAAGNTLTLIGMGWFSGKYFIHHCVHKLLAGQTRLRIRKVLEGY